MKVEEKTRRLYDCLVGLVGSEDVNELENMKNTINGMIVSGLERKTLIAAIDLIIEIKGEYK